ncbi:MAG: cytochrome c3 family protein [Deltaproteobacteria bacterium]|nr:cytochrome c3 family protein [Deltaproteobacteria bacterium]
MHKNSNWRWCWLPLLLAMILLPACSSDKDADDNQGVAGVFATSLHGTRAGKATWYNDTDGFKTMVTVDYADLPCADCHNKAVWENRPAAEGGPRAWIEPNCLDCHATTPGDEVADSSCLGCHSRQGTEISLGLTDVHRDGGQAMGCMDCHTQGDVHGDGTSYTTMFEPGAIDAKCQNCHSDATLAGVNDFHDSPHMDAIDCSACHMTSAITCYNCHFDNEADETGSILHAKFASAKFGGPGEKAWRFLINRVVDEQGNTKIFAGSMQSLMADVTASSSPGEDNLGATFVAIGPYYSHSIQKNAITCEDCHASAAMQQYVDQGVIDVVKWKPEAGVAVAAAQMGAEGWQGPKGVIPVPPDYSTALKFDFVDLVTPDAPLNASSTSSSDRVLFKRGADYIHFVDEYVQPLTSAQMEKLGWFSYSLHATRAGKETFYYDGFDEASPALLQAGFGNYVDVPYADLPCVDCHNAKDNGPWDTDPAEGSVTDSWPGNPVCRDCHGNSTAGKSPVVGSTVGNDVCKGCHSRLGAEAAVGMTDVHAAFSCSQCHALGDIHGVTGEKPATMFDGAITADCQSCHTPTTTVMEHAVHLSGIDCSTCHMQSVVTCYNCHFDNEAIKDGSVLHAKFASAKFGGPGEKSWRFLVNKVMADGSTKVFPGSMQSLAADVTASNFPGEDNQGATFVAIAPYYAHAITKTDALTCDTCHGTQTAMDLAAGTAVDVVAWNAADGVEVPVASMMATWQAPSGVIPVPENTSLLGFDFIDLVDPAAALTPTATSSSARRAFKRDADVIHMPADYVLPLTAAQMTSLSFIHNSGANCATCHTP